MSRPGSISGHDVRHRGTWDVIRVASTASTNADLLAAVEAGDVSAPTALAADHQTAGRGRLDRTWDAPPGANLLVSLLFVDVPEPAVRLTQAVGLAAVRAVETLAGADLRSRLGMKWPNDLLLDDRKLAGVLAQRSLSAGAVVVGIGLNVGWAPDGASCLHADLDLDTATPTAVLDHMLDALDAQPPAECPDDVAADVRSRLLTIGREVRIELPGSEFIVGVATDLDADGRLVVAPDDGGSPRTLDVGDIVHLRPR